MDGLCEVRACDHRSSTTAYGLTRFACRAAVFVGVDAMQDRTKCTASVCTTGVLSVLPKGPAPLAAGHGPAPSGRSPEESGAARQPAPDHDARPCLLTMAMKLATRSGLQLQPLLTATHKTPPRAAAVARAGSR